MTRWLCRGWKPHVWGKWEGTHGAHLHRGEAVQKLLVDAGIKLHVLHLTTAGLPRMSSC